MGGNQLGRTCKVRRNHACVPGGKPAKGDRSGAIQRHRSGRAPPSTCPREEQRDEDGEASREPQRCPDNTVRSFGSPVTITRLRAAYLRSLGLRKPRKGRGPHRPRPPRDSLAPPAADLLSAIKNTQPPTCRITYCWPFDIIEYNLRDSR